MMNAAAPRRFGLVASIGIDHEREKNEMTLQQDIELIDRLRSFPPEQPWLEFEVNQSEPKRIGTHIAALANAARSEGKEMAFLIWGVERKSRDVVGTTFEPFSKKVGNREFELWLRDKVRPVPELQFRSIAHPEGRIQLLEIPATIAAPTTFEGIPYIRLGGATVNLADDHFRYEALIQKLRPYAWDNGFAANRVTGDDVLDLLDLEACFSLTREPFPADRKSVFGMLEAENLIHPDVGERWNIRNFCALLFAKELRKFSHSLGRKGVRFVRYDGTRKSDPVTCSVDFQKGYAAGFQELFRFVGALLPRNERIEAGIRRDHPSFPMPAVRELVANALIHQDMTVTGAGPMIELFSDRIEISNPGTSLIATERMVDHPPKSRNEVIAGLMRRMGMCEERGSGLHRVFAEVEQFRLPAPRLNAFDEAMQVTLYGPKAFSEMNADERMRACYWHAVLRHLAGDRMSNATLRHRLGIGRRSAAQASVVIGRALKDGVIKHADPEQPRAGYRPAWA